MLKHAVILTVMATCSIELIAQKLPDSVYSDLSGMKSADFYAKKGRNMKAIGYSSLGLGSILLVTGTSIIINDALAGQGNEDLGSTLMVIGAFSMAASYPLLSAGARNKGKSEILLLDPHKTPISDLTKRYKRKARTNGVIAWSLVGTAIVVPIAIQNSRGYEGPSDAEQAISSIASLGIFVSIPFFMESAKNKGRISILTRAERLPVSYLQNAGLHQTVGVGIPIGKR